MLRVTQTYIHDTFLMIYLHTYSHMFKYLNTHVWKDVKFRYSIGYPISALSTARARPLEHSPTHTSTHVQYHILSSHITSPLSRSIKLKFDANSTYEQVWWPNTSWGTATTSPTITQSANLLRARNRPRAIWSELRTFVSSSIVEEMMK